MTTNDPSWKPPDEGRYWTQRADQHLSTPETDQRYWTESPQRWSTNIPQPTNGLAVAGFVLGILWLFWLGSALAIAFGHIALAQIEQKNEAGKGLAIAGLVLGYIGAGTFALFVVLPLLLGMAGA